MDIMVTDIIGASGVRMPNRNMTIKWVREVRNPHPMPHPLLMPHPNQMLMPQPGITDITDMATYMATDITVTVILIMDITDITGEEDKKFEIFWKKIFFSTATHKKNQAI